MLCFFLFPIYWMISTAVKPTDELFSIPLHWIPSSPTLSNFSAALTRYNGAAAFRNSLIAAGGATLLALVVGAAAAYSMAAFAPEEALSRSGSCRSGSCRRSYW